MSSADGEWEDMGDGRLRRRHPLGFSIVKPREDDTHVPFECPVCEQLMRFATDPHSYAKYQCCSTCATMWAEARREEWAAGWRPGSDVIAAYVATLSGNKTDEDAT